MKHKRNDEHFLSYARYFSMCTTAYIPDKTITW